MNCVDITVQIVTKLANKRAQVTDAKSFIQLIYQIHTKQQHKTKRKSKYLKKKNHI